VIENCSSAGDVLFGSKRTAATSFQEETFNWNSPHLNESIDSVDAKELSELATYPTDR